MYVVPNNINTICYAQLIMTTTRLEKSINGLKKILERHNRSQLFDFSLQQVIIKPNGDTKWGIWFYFLLLIVTPVGILIYLLTKSNPEVTTLVLLTILAIYFIIQFSGLLKGQQNVIVDFSKKEFVFERHHKFFSVKKTPLSFDFEKVHKVILKEKALRYNNRWMRLNFIDANGSVLTYVDLGADYPDSLIADKIKFFVEVVLWTYNKKEL